MKVVYLGIILIFLLVAISYVTPIYAEPSDPVHILNVQVQPNIIKVNDTFSLNIMILNNFAFPIYLTSGSCTPAFSVMFDVHAKQVYPNIACTAEAILQRVDPQSQVTISNANKPGVIYQAVQPGTATVNITLPYYAKNQTATDYSNIYYNTSKSILFTIYDNDTNSPVITKEELNKKLDAAREKISNIMMNNTTDIPFNMVGINIVNSTLEVGIDSTKATLSAEQYKEKIKEIVGDLPITLVIGHIQLLGNSTSEQKDSSTSFVMSPLKQFKSGVAANNIICRPDLQLLIQNQENFPICVKLDTVPILLYRDWSYPTNCKYVHDPFTAGVEGLIVIEKNASDPSSDKSYSPSNSTVVIGWNNTISWINQDVYPSSVTSDWNLFDSGSILSGNDWKHNFDCAGNYGYHSEPHPWMKGWIRVLPPSR